MANPYHPKGRKKCLLQLHIMTFMKKNALITASFILLIFSACKKDISPTENNNNPNTSLTPQIDLFKDSVYLFTKEIYLWNDLLPSYDQFNPRQYGGATLQEAGTNVMNSVKKLQPLDRFSFVTTKAKSDGLQSGQNAEVGFFIKAASIDKAEPIDSVHWFVTYVYNQSEAGLAGVQRGWFINKLNGTAIGYDQQSLSLLNNVFFSSNSTASFEFVKPDGTTATANLSKTSFTANSVLHQSVLDVSGKKVGYLVFNQFFGESSRVELTNVFNSFKSAGVNELVVDLRYNPGGSTQTQDALANLIAPSAATNQIMYKYVFNKNLQNGSYPLLKTKPGYNNASFSQTNNTQKFSNTGGLALNRVFFIVSKSSASASELLINNLKPYMDVKLIGDTTYGKPVGFFPVDIFDLSIYPISFKTVNSAGNADYYKGFAPDKSAPDGVTYNWGDKSEPSLASALKYISTGSFRSALPQNENDYQRQMRVQKTLEPLTLKLEEQKFSGMFVEK